MDEMNIQPVDLGDEVRQRLQPRLAFVPVVFVCPVLCELLVTASCTPCDASVTKSRSRPVRQFYSAKHVGKFRFGDIHVERSNGGIVCHRALLSRSGLSVCRGQCGNWEQRCRDTRRANLRPSRRLIRPRGILVVSVMEPISVVVGGVTPLAPSLASARLANASPQELCPCARKRPLSVVRLC